MVSENGLDRLEGLAFGFLPALSLKQQPELDAAVPALSRVGATPFVAGPPCYQTSPHLITHVQGATGADLELPLAGHHLCMRGGRQESFKEGWVDMWLVWLRYNVRREHQAARRAMKKKPHRGLTSPQPKAPSPHPAFHPALRPSPTGVDARDVDSGGHARLQVRLSQGAAVHALVAHSAVEGALQEEGGEGGSGWRCGWRELMPGEELLEWGSQ